MAATKKSTTQDEEIMRGAWDWAGDACAHHACGIRVALVPATRLGCWKIRAQAVDVVEGRARGVKVQVEVDWPTAHYQSLAGALMNALMRLDHELGYDELARTDTP